MRQIKLFNYFVNSTYLLLAVIEFGVLMAAGWTGIWLRFRSDPEALQINLQDPWISLMTFAAALTALNVAMRIYPVRFREGFMGMAIRTVVAYFLLGSLALEGLYRFVPISFLGHGVAAYALPLA